MKRLFAAIVIILLIAITLYQQFNFKGKPDIKQLQYISYTVKEGDCLSVIAERYKPDHEQLDNYINMLQYANNTQEGIYPGQRLKIPVY